VPPVLVLSPDDPTPIAGVDQVLYLDPEPFQSIRRVIFEFGLVVYLKLALFTLKDFDRIVYFDLDTLIVDDVSELWDPSRYADKDLYAVREEARYGGRAPMIGHLNSGVMIINRPMLDRSAFQTALSLARAGVSLDSGDQGVINVILSDASHGFAAGDLDPMLNVMINDITLGSGILRTIPVRILHFTGNFKPWDRGAEIGVPYGTAMRRLWLVHTHATSTPPAATTVIG
jgi:lipopolysaccharide biosynthesis glycosyltransferase